MFDAAVDRGADRMYADEAKDISPQHFYRVRPKPQTVDKARHAHGDNDARRFVFQDLHEPAQGVGDERRCRWLKDNEALGRERLDLTAVRGRNWASCDCNGAMSFH